MLLSPAHWESRNSWLPHDTWKVLTARPRDEAFPKSLRTAQASSSGSTVGKSRMLKALSEKVLEKVQLQTSRVTFKSIAPELSLRSSLI